MARWLTGVATLAVLGATALSAPANAADEGVPLRAAHPHHHYYYVRYARDCGCCGCWYPRYVYHRQILYTYPSDPRYTLTSEPRYVRGGVRKYIDNLF